MKSKFKQRLSRRIWPDEMQNLLLGAVLLDNAEAADCWKEWKSRCDIENAAWEELKVFSRLAGRLASIAPDCPFRLRLEGLARAHWTQSQIMLRSSANALDLLIAEDIPIMLLKGGALHAAHLENRGPRVAGDLDVLVRRSDYPRSIKLLYAAGWRSKDSAEVASVRWRFSAGTNLRLKPHGDIDIHHQPVHGARVKDEVLDALWGRADRVDFHGRSVLIPSFADLLVIASAHAVHNRISNEPGVSWVFDIAVLAQQAAVNPENVVESACAFNALPATLATLSFLQYLTNESEVEQLVLALEANRAGWRPWLQFLLQSKPHGKLQRSLAKRIVRLQGAESSREVVPRIYPNYFARHTAHSIAGSDSNTGLSLRHEIPLPQSSSMSKLVLELAFKAEVARRYQFDISADGLSLVRASARVRTTESEVIRRFIIRLPAQEFAYQQFAIESLAAKMLPENASATQIRYFSSVPFRIVRLSWH